MVGLVALVVLLAPTLAQLRAAACALGPGMLAALVATRSDAVRALEGSMATRERDGLVVLAALVVLMALAAGLQVFASRWPQRTYPVAAARRLAVAAIVVALVAVPVAVGLAGSGGGDAAGFGASTSRLGSASSNRADYWSVAWDAAGSRPLRGLGAGGFGPAWLRDRPYPEPVRDAHSLPLETLAELGLVGLALLLALVGRRRGRRSRCAPRERRARRRPGGGRRDVVRARLDRLGLGDAGADARRGRLRGSAAQRSGLSSRARARARCAPASSPAAARTPASASQET